MPHSGGGGSHSGGHHSGRSHSKGNSRPSRSKRYYPGAKKYIYYYNGNPCIYYADRKYDPRKEGILPLIFSIIWLLTIIPVFLSFLNIQGGTLPLDYDSNIYIEDNIGIIKDKEKLTNYLETFKEQSGVSISVITENLNTDTMGITCENKAYNKYVNLWDDESHWLIYYLGDELDRSDNWEWNLMCGDDCLKVLSVTEEDTFTEEFHRRLVAKDRYTFEDAVIESLKKVNIKTNKRLMFANQEIDPMIIMIITIGLGIGIITFILGIVKILPTEENKAQLTAIPINDKSKKVKCNFCDKTYYDGIDRCPYCNTTSNYSTPIE